MEWLHFCLCCYSLWHHGATTIAPVTSYWETYGGALSNQNAALMVLPSSNNSTWYELDISNTIKFSTHDEGENICCSGIWQWTTHCRCYLIELEAVPFVQLSNTSLEWLIFIYYNGIRSHCIFACAWTNGRANNRHTGDLRWNRAHYDVILVTFRNLLNFHLIHFKSPIVSMQMFIALNAWFYKCISSV